METEPTTTQIREAASRGAELFDQRFGDDWVNWVDMDRLDMSSPYHSEHTCGCIASQVDAHTHSISRGGSYSCGLKYIFDDDAWDSERGTEDTENFFGFHLDVSKEEHDAKYQYLTACWKLEILSRRKSAESVGVGQGKGEDDKGPSAGPSY